MKKGIIFAVIGFVVALAASTFLGVQKGKKAAAAAALVAAAHADSVKAANASDSTAGRDSTAPHGAAPGTEAAPDSATPHEAAAAPVPHADPVAAAPKIVPISTVNPAAKADAYKQVARVLSAMKAAEAAKVLAFLSDEEVEGILRAVGPRQAADFMTNLPKERAAGLSRRLLVPKPKEQGK
jgi:hypothetical protein